MFLVSIEYIYSLPTIPSNFLFEERGFVRAKGSSPSVRTCLQTVSVQSTGARANNALPSCQLGTVQARSDILLHS